MVVRTLSRLAKHIDSCTFFETHKHIKIGLLGVSDYCCTNKIIKVLNSAYANNWIPYNTIIPQKNIKDNIKEQIMNHSITEPNILAIVPKEHISIKDKLHSDSVVSLTIDPKEKMYDYILE